MANKSLPDRWYQVVAKALPFSFVRGAASVAMLAVILGLLNWFAPGAPTLPERLLSTSALVLAAIPLWLWLSGIDRGTPFMPFFAMVYAAYYSVPFFLLESHARGINGPPFSPRLMTEALGLVLAGLLAALLGYYGPQHHVVARALPRARLRWRSSGNVKFWAMIFSFAGLLIYALDMTIALPEALDQVVLFGGDLCSVGICMLFVLQLTGRLDRLSVILLWSVLVPLRLSLGLSTGFAAQGLIFVLTLVMAYASIRRAIPWKILIVGAVAFLLVRPALTPFRVLTWKGGMMSGASRVEKARLVFEMVMRAVGGSVPYEVLFQYGVSRVATDLMTLPEVLRDTPDHVPYWKGESYYTLMFKPVPRFLYPNKPREETGQTFGHRYGLLDLIDNETSYNLPQLVELYINFSTLGVLVGMFLYGLIARAVQDVFVHPDMGLGAVVAVVYVSVKLLAMESAASLMLGALLFALVFIGFINLVMQAGELDMSNVGVRS